MSERLHRRIMASKRRLKKGWRGGGKGKVSVDGKKMFKKLREVKMEV